MSRVLVMAGTQKGAFFFSSDEARREWRVEGPLLKGWEVLDIALDDRREPTLWASVGHFVYGATIQVSRDLGATWTQIEKGPSYPADAGRKMEKVWCVRPGHPSEPEVLWAGVAEAGLFRSENSGESWHEVPALNEHATRAAWSPGAGGLCCHTIELDPENPKRLWVGISAVGVFRSDDAGATWQTANEGMPIAVPAEDEAHRAVGSCVHKMAVAPDDPTLLYQQNHQGMLRSRDGAKTWQRIENGLPSTFGFPLVVHPHDSRTLFTVPLESDEYRFPPEGRLEVYRSRDGGDSWQGLDRGLPADPFYAGALRNCLAADGVRSGEGCGVYLGTTGGQIFYSRNSGDSWQALPAVLPRIGSVTAVVVE